MSFFSKLKKSLSKTQEAFVEKIEQVFLGVPKIDEDLFDDLEEILITADLGVQTSDDLLETLRQKVREDKLHTGDQVIEALKEEMAKLLGDEIVPLNIEEGRLNIILVVGVNGVGKTTLVGKLANRYQAEGYKVLVAAADTFRAAAIEQLEIWCERAGVDMIKHQAGADPAAVVFDTIQAGKARGTDVILIDTAGRLHNKGHLMDEMNKIYRVIKREVEDAPHETLLVLDATTGQNAVLQAKAFDEVSNVTALALTKLDGTAKGGIVIAISQQMDIPVKLVGLGEGIDDLRDFDPSVFVAALFDRNQVEEQEEQEEEKDQDFYF
ncbi:MAG: signal recognition particle-docking protein FtsY [Firmicutes bacterium]|nr:signal recognition particle-docking protein FtsY [Bacillota bacterium]